MNGLRRPAPAAPGVVGGALSRAIRRPTGSAAAHGCDLCAVPMPEAHRHVLDRQGDEVLCVCRACTLLFEREAAARGHYRLIPEQRRRLTGLEAGRLGVPVGLAFFVRGAESGVVAHYPSPLGLTQAGVEPADWEAMCDGCPALADLAESVEALLVNTARGAHQYWIVPVDDCYRLSALIRGEWRGMSGGSRVWPMIDQFFDDLDRRPGSPLRSVASAEREA